MKYHQSLPKAKGPGSSRVSRPQRCFPGLGPPGHGLLLLQLPTHAAFEPPRHRPAPRRVRRSRGDGGGIGTALALREVRLHLAGGGLERRLLLHFPENSHGICSLPTVKVVTFHDHVFCLLGKKSLHALFYMLKWIRLETESARHGAITKDCSALEILKHRRTHGL